MKAGLAFVLLLTSGCTVHMGQQDGEDRYFVGLVKVSRPVATGGVRADKVQSFGLVLDRGFYLGWQANEEISMLPDECRVVFLIRDKADLAHAGQMAATLGEKPCVIDWSQPLP